MGFKRDQLYNIQYSEPIIQIDMLSIILDSEIMRTF